ncbi:hypothetical protein [uncultured Chryseobacterium sp.]|jgi:hypothetical protein|uniref:hypothetical protein n=1 Tax=uncultured Chryseobacterium sp. TaxID=259322 RepID=UPI00263172A1|nr:hypothetical protein [uncultured Chryseobacterium sp.]
MKRILTTILIALNVTLFAQENMNSKLNELFMDLNLDATPEIMTQNSKIKFDFGINKGIDWVGGDTKHWNGKFKNHKLIDSKVKQGQISIIQNSKEIESNIFEINERIELYNETDLISEYNKLFNKYQDLSFYSKNIRVESENSNVKSDTIEFFIKDGESISKLSLTYIIPTYDPKSYFLIVSFKNKIRHTN